MRSVLIAVALVLSACASSPTATAPSPEIRSAGTWTFGFDAGPGIAIIELGGTDGRPLVRVTCQAPRGAMMITDWSFARGRQGDTPATVTVGGSSKAVTARIGGDGAGRIALTASIDPRDPVFNALTPSAAVTVSAGGYTHVWAAGAASRLNDVINSCRTLGS